MRVHALLLIKRISIFEPESMDGSQFVKCLRASGFSTQQLVHEFESQLESLVVRM